MAIVVGDGDDEMLTVLVSLSATGMTVEGVSGIEDCVVDSKTVVELLRFEFHL